LISVTSQKGMVNIDTGRRIRKNLQYVMGSDARLSFLMNHSLPGTYILLGIVLL
jgi:hypothetical protein